MTHVVQVLGRVVVHERLPGRTQASRGAPLFHVLGWVQPGHEGLQAELGPGDVRRRGVYVCLVVQVTQEVVVQPAEHLSQSVRGLDPRLRVR